MQLEQLWSWVEDRYPAATAESWDAVGPVVGSPSDEVKRVLLTVDVTDAVLDEAERVGADAIIAHHPLLLRGIHAVRGDSPKGRLITRLIRSRIALITAHTNADLPAGGTVDALAAALGLVDPVPLVPRPTGALDKITTYVPADHLSVVREALADAGAGAIGRYDRCSFATDGVGRFRPLEGAGPFLGRVGAVEQVPETRLEMILERFSRGPVVAALLAAHPYETPAYDVVEVASTDPATAGLGRVGDLGDATTLGAFAHRALDVLPTTPAGIRIAGDLDRPVRRVAVQAGAGDDLFDEARRSGADVYLTSDLRHHPASEALAHDGAPALIDVPHWAAEWMWLPLLAAQLAPTDLTVHISTLCTDPWTAALR